MEEEPHQPGLGSRVPSLLAGSVVEAQAGSSRLDAFWANGPALLVFVRHFGCVGCSEQVTELAWRLRELERAGVSTVIIGSSSPGAIDDFIERHALADKPVIIATDPTLGAFRAAGLIRSRWGSIGPRGMFEALRAMGRGHRHHGLQGDALQQGGAILVDRTGVVRLYHRNRSLGDYVRTNELVQAALRLAVSSASVRV